MIERSVTEQPPVLFEAFHDFGIGFEDMLPDKLRNRGRELPAVIDRRQDFQPLTDAGLGIVGQHQQVVFHAVARRDVHAARSLFQRDEVAQEQRRKAGGQGTLGLQAFKSL